MAFRISDDLIAEDNAKRKPVLDEDFAHRGRVLRRRGVGNAEERPAQAGRLSGIA